MAPWRLRWPLYLAMFVIGGTGLAYEFTLSKLASDLLGHSVRQWALVIGVMMFCMGLGSAWQRRVPDRWLGDGFVGAELALAALGALAPLGLLFLFGAAPAHYSLGQFFAVAVLGFLIGIEIPLLARLNEAATPALSENLGRMLEMDYLGALAGALVWTFVLPTFFDTVASAVVLGIANGAVALFVVVSYRHRIRWPRAWGAAGALLVVGLLGLLQYADEWSIAAEQRLFRDRIVWTHRSPYQRLVLTESASGTTQLYINGHLQFSSFDEHMYHENLVHPAAALIPALRDVLVLGGGDGLAVRELLKYPELRAVTVVDLDPAMTELARTRPALVRLNEGAFLDARVVRRTTSAVSPGSSHPVDVENQWRRWPLSRDQVGTVQLVHLDAARFVQDATGRYDLIVLDFPDPNAPDLSKLYARHFYVALSRLLRPGGLLVQQSTSPVHAKEAFLCIGRTMRAAGLAVLPYHDNVPTFGEWGFWMGGRAEEWSEAKLAAGVSVLSRIRVPTRYLTATRMIANLSFGRGQLVSEHSDINTLTRDRVYAYYQEAFRHAD